MSFLITKQQNPDYHSYANRRTEFRLNTNNQLDARVRLGIDIQNAVVNQYYFGVGASALWKQIDMLSDNILIDSTTTRGSQLSAWLNTSGSDQSNSKQLNLVNPRIANNWFNLPVLSNYAFPVAPGVGDENVLITTPATQTLQWSQQLVFDLSDYLPVLKSIMETPNRNFNFKNLKFVFHWNEITDIVWNPAAPVADFSPNPPVLIYEEYQGEQPPPLNSLSYRSWEVDRSIIPAVVDGVAQSFETQLNGFNNKSLNRLLIMTVPPQIPGVDGLPQMGKYCSSSQKDETIAISWNNVDLTVSPINNKTKQLYLLQLTNKLQPMCSDQFGIENFDIISNVDQYVIGVNSWGLVDFQDLPINTLKIKYGRTGNDDPEWGVSQLDLVVFGLVNKALTVRDNGEVLVAYV